MNINKNDKNRIERIINLLRNIYPEFNLNNIIEDIKFYLEISGIVVRYSDMSHLKMNNVSGYVFLKNNTPIIVVNGDKPEFERRFIIAQLLGHIILNWKFIPGRTVMSDRYKVLHSNIKTVTESSEDFITDEFAVSFLAPNIEIEKSIIKFNKKCKTSEDVIIALSEFYKIPMPIAYKLWFNYNFNK